MTQAPVAVSQLRQTREERTVVIEPLPPATLDSDGAWQVTFDDKRWVGLVNVSIWDVFTFIGTQP